MASDTLSAITNQSIPGELDAEEGNSGHGYCSPALWSNRSYTEHKGCSQPASIIFTYDTQELLGRATIYFCSAGNSLRYPNPRTTRWFISNPSPNGPWIGLETVEAIEAAPFPQKVKRYTYDFEPVMATYVRLEIRNAHTPARTAERLEACSRFNAAITILPIHNNMIRILTESEDHTKRREYRIFPGRKPAL